MKTFLNTLTLIIGTALSAVVLWSFLYLCIPGIKDGTDKLFKWNDYKEEIEQEPAEDDFPDTISPASDTQITFENEFLTITLG